jgi:hypothetical protein
LEEGRNDFIFLSNHFDGIFSEIPITHLVNARLCFEPHFFQPPSPIRSFILHAGESIREEAQFGTHERNDNILPCITAGTENGPGLSLITAGTGNDPELSLITGGPEGNL